MTNPNKNNLSLQLGKRKCRSPEHKRIPDWFNCGINGDCTNTKGHNQHCMVFNCDMCAFEDNLEEIFTELLRNKKNTKGLNDASYDYINFILLRATFGQCLWNLKK